MPNFFSVLRTVGKSRILRQNNIKPFTRHQNRTIDVGEIGNYVSVRCLSSIAGVDRYCSRDLIRHSNELLNSSHNLQKRWFLGVGDGEEGTLSKVHEEKLVLGYSPEQLFAVVAAVDMYEGFLPWCQRSEIIRHHPDGSFDAELEIGFKFLVESYVSHVVLDKPKYIKTTASESNLFEHLINIWEFRPGPTPGTCNVYFLVDFKFRSPLYRQVASMFFREVVSRLVSSFTDRCRLIYGPGAAIEQNA
ncbi:coenzyme Q-binding protein COQ10 homolog, mitochondrial-like [Chenopodium quinoa]|uniref:Coenzyme Q-binding protein COQ10 START domain-containing protein n=1 Tax=Chenopodium quinoa TaxID=63459 RepID=A0A803LNZ3_CHEQI|nr:coenzyme Q-binding protein COQ10 homolog, mitochondrial-like [Chenopodium quinoa]